jgi:hypothetical protein
MQVLHHPGSSLPGLGLGPAIPCASAYSRARSMPASWPGSNSWPRWHWRALSPLAGTAAGPLEWVEPRSPRAEAAPDAPAHRPLGGPQAPGPPHRHGFGAVSGQGPHSSGALRGPITPGLGPWTGVGVVTEGGEARQPDRAGRRMPRWGVGPLPFPVSYGFLASLRRHRDPAGGC